MIFVLNLRPLNIISISIIQSLNCRNTLLISENIFYKKYLETQIINK